MKYDTGRISQELKRIQAPDWAQSRIQSLTERTSDEQNVSLCLRNIISDLTEAISDAENSPLDTKGREQVEVYRRSSEYLESFFIKNNH